MGEFGSQFPSGCFDITEHAYFSELYQLIVIDKNMHQSKPTKTVRLHDVKRWLQSQFMAAYALFQVEQKRFIYTSVHF